MKVRYFAGAAEAAGLDEQEIDARGMTASALIAHLSEGNPALTRVLGVAALLADGARIDSTTMDLSEVKQVDVLPPFAGG